ncbi:MAG: penicillin-binding protein 1C [Polyangiaceae bacterium]|nr:penicillin-binding protein 1C [Polyangiaceae bacterium]
MKRYGRVLRAAIAAAMLVLGLPFTILGIYALTLQVPDIQEPATVPGEREDSVRVVDRGGTLLREVRASDGRRAQRTSLAGFGDRVPKALLAAEDKRFYDHAGIDPIAMARAAIGSAREGRIVSGASTLSQQLARSVSGEQRTAAGKLRVMALALRLELAYDKDEILEAYLNRIEFGPNVRGAEAAAELYFGKPCADLSLAEAAAVASIPRGPTLYDPTKRPGHLVRRRDRVLDRMLEAGFATEEEVQRAKAEPLALAPRFSPASAPHFVSALLGGKLGPTVSDDGVVTTSVLAELQADATEAARRTVAELEGQGVTAASVVVLDNRTGEILAYVGSPDLGDTLRLGGNDGVLALRQPGSALKPFVYELGMEKLDLVPSSLLPDIDLSFPGPDGASFRPRNYDGRYHGPVLLRDALGSSFNVPAVHVAERLGTRAVLDRLRDLGFSSLDQAAEHYGLAIALGDGEVRLLDLANAYATLARGGVVLPVRAIPTAAPLPEGRRVLSERQAFMTTHVLADPPARVASFGDDSALDLPFEAAAKTGTSKGYRDNFAVGYTPEITVAVWVGNFDGSPMRGVSGITGAGPLFREVMLAAARHRAPTPFVEPEGFHTVEVCALSGHRPGPDCPHRRVDILPVGHDPSECTMHVHVAVDRATGERAGEDCPERFVEDRVFEAFPPLYAEWAKAVRRQTVPTTFSTRCPSRKPIDLAVSGGVRILYPRDGAKLFVDADGRLPSVRVKLSADDAVILSVDGKVSNGRVLVLSPGEHTLRAVARGSSDEVHVSVE